MAPWALGQATDYRWPTTSLRRTLFISKRPPTFGSFDPFFGPSHRLSMAGPNSRMEDMSQDPMPGEVMRKYLQAQMTVSKRALSFG